MVDSAAQLICDASRLQNGGLGVRFEVFYRGATCAAFVIRHDGVVYGYLNRCRHVPAELDWQEGRFFDSGADYLVCSIHGALYLPDSGYCIAGPCRGQSLLPLTVTEQDGRLYYLPQPGDR